MGLWQAKCGQGCGMCMHCSYGLGCGPNCGRAVAGLWQPCVLQLWQPCVL